MNGRAWTEEENQRLFELYPDLPTEEVARQLHRTVRATYNQSKKIGVGKSAAFLAQFCRLQKGSTIGLSGRFPKGHVPANKGLHRPGFGPGRMKETQFKKGSCGGRATELYKPIGSERISKDGYLERKVNDDMPFQKRWRAVHILIWEKENGPLPAGHVLVFKNRDKRDIRLENLELITRRDLMLRNTIHHLPPELKGTIMLAGRVKRAIRKRIKNDASQKQP